MDGGGGTLRPVLLTGAKKTHLGCLISFEIPMGFQNFVVIKKIHFKKKKFAMMQGFAMVQGLAMVQGFVMMQ